MFWIWYELLSICWTPLPFACAILSEAVQLSTPTFFSVILRVFPAPPLTSRISHVFLSVATGTAPVPTCVAVSLLTFVTSSIVFEGPFPPHRSTTRCCLLPASQIQSSRWFPPLFPLLWAHSTSPALCVSVLPSPWPVARLLIRFLGWGFPWRTWSCRWRWAVLRLRPRRAGRPTLYIRICM